jgi:hypothetical protein
LIFLSPLPTYSYRFFGTFQNADGKIRDAWGATAILLTDLALTPDFKHLVAVGMECPSTPPITEATQSRGVQAGDPASVPPGGMIVFDFATKQTESCVVFAFFLAIMTTENILMHWFADAFVCARIDQLIWMESSQV